MEGERKKPKKKYSIDDYPFYEPNTPPRYHQYQSSVSYLDELEACWGKPWGAQGIGRLREVAMVRPTNYETDPIFKKDPVYFMSDVTDADIEEIKRCHDRLVAAIKGEDIKIKFWEYPDPPLGAYGLLKRTMTGALLVVNGGAIIPRGSTPYVRGREVYRTKFIASIGCPILYTVHGKGIFEVGGCRKIADDAILVYQSPDCNPEGLEQVRPILERAGYKEIVVGHSPGLYKRPNKELLGSYHPDMWFLSVGYGIGLIYPAYCDYNTIRWFEDHHFDLIEVPKEEQLTYWPPNGICIEPGKVIMPKGADYTIRELRKRNVQVIEVEYTEAFKYGGGMSCTIGELIRDQGPTLAELVAYKKTSRHRAGYHLVRFYEKRNHSCKRKKRQMKSK